MRKGTEMNKTIRYTVAVITLIALSGALLPANGLAAPSAVSLVYDEGLANGWQNWSWGSSVTLQDPSYKYTGNVSASCAYTSAWAGFYFGHAGFNTAGYDTLSFYVNGGAASNHNVVIAVADAAGNFLPGVDLDSYVAGGSIAANT